jgi:cellobiose dehydrogenase (acceptor)
MTITQYLGTGTVSRGRMTIQPNLNTRVITPPYLRDSHDTEAVIQGIDYIRSALSKIDGLTWVVPTKDQTTTAFVNSVSYHLLPLSLLFTCVSHTLYSYPAHIVKL